MREPYPGMGKCSGAGRRRRRPHPGAGKRFLGRAVSLVRADSLGRKWFPAWKRRIVAKDWPGMPERSETGRQTAGRFSPALPRGPPAAAAHSFPPRISPRKSPGGSAGPSSAVLKCPAPPEGSGRPPPGDTAFSGLWSPGSPAPCGSGSRIPWRRGAGPPAPHPSTDSSYLPP